MSGHEEKATRYVGLLDVDRCSAAWNEFPERIRKVTKHAPNRTILIQTATAEHQIATGATSSSPLGALEQALSTGNNASWEDVCQAKACLAWANWLSGEGSGNTLMMSPTLEQEFQELDKRNTTTWTKVCLVKYAYIEGTKQLLANQPPSTFPVAAAWIERNTDLVAKIPQLAYWSEQLLAQYALTVDQNERRIAQPSAFRVWEKLASKTPSAGPQIYKNTNVHVPRTVIWKQYYLQLSQNLRSGKTLSDDPSARLEEATQLRIAEAAWEREILRLHNFPKAAESNKSIEGWVEEVIQNWEILCGPDWHDADLGQGGRDARTRNVLDILYRAATKTFHSTLILRRLFQIHKSLAEFDLAYQCLDTYIELTDRARERAAKSGEASDSQEPLETFLLTIAEGIEGLCQFGRQSEAQKAFELSNKLEDLLEEPFSESVSPAVPNGYTNGVEKSKADTAARLSSFTTEVVYRAIGIGKAQWAFWTPFSEKRAELREEALEDLTRACTGRDGQVETVYALALLLAQSREMNPAIALVKKALQDPAKSRSQTKTFSNERKMLPLWHLMTLLLTSQQSFEMAGSVCAAAFDQYPHTSALLGTTGRTGNKISTQAKGATRADALADDMECDELQRVVELHITSLALSELLEGPESAINHASELLSLCSRLFERFGIGTESAPMSVQRSIEPPKSSAGTVKSFRESILRHRRTAPPSVAQSSTRDSGIPSDRTTTKDQSLTQEPQAPTIQVTDEGGHAPAHRHHTVHLAHKKPHPKGTVTQSPSKSIKGHTQTSRDAALAEGLSARGSLEADVLEGSASEYLTEKIPATVPEGSEMFTTPQYDTTPNDRQPAREIPHNSSAPQELPPPAGHGERPEQDTRLPTLSRKTTATSPISRFQRAASQRHAWAIIVKIWLLIATLYRRSHMFDDAREACEEASKTAVKIESSVSAEDTSARHLAEAGWGGCGKSSDEIWADVYCEQAELWLAIALRPRVGGHGDDNLNLREAIDHYEQCLMYCPDHAGGIVGISNLLLDYYERKIDLGRKVDDGQSNRADAVQQPSSAPDTNLKVPNGNISPAQGQQATDAHTPSLSLDEDLKKTPDNLNRIAARDRAYGLLSTLTKLGSAWDDSQAWMALARAHELGGEVEKAQSILWWCIELEDSRPIRHWRNLTCNGYVL